ncbi:hypothetical protein SHIRM173S_00412 [Streptomyces hirsutus]
MSTPITPPASAAASGTAGDAGCCQDAVTYQRVRAGSWWMR